MSGHKRATITITRDEYERLREARHNLRTIPEVPEPMQDRLAQQRIDAFENSLLALGSRHEQFQSMLGGLSKNIRQVEQANAEVLLEIQTNTLQLAQQAVNALSNQTEKLIAEQTQQFRTAITQNQNQNREALQQIRQEIDRVSQGEERKLAAAQQWYSNNIRFYNFINENYACEFFLPGRMENISQQIQLVWQNMENGSYEAALSSAQQIHFTLSDLHIQLEQLDSEWQMLYINTWETTMQLLAQAVESMNVPGIDLDGELLPYTIHVDSWMENGLSQLIHEIRAFRDHLEKEGNGLSTTTFHEYREQTLPVFQKELETLIAKARINAINAQLRVNIADFVIQALRQQGFSPSGAGYETDDAQSDYQVSFSNYEGSEVIVQIKSAGPKIGQNELHIESLDQQVRSENELENRWYAISHSLEQVGLSVGPYIREERPPYQSTGPGPQGRRHIQQRSPRAGRNVTRHGS